MREPSTRHSVSSGRSAHYAATYSRDSRRGIVARVNLASGKVQQLGPIVSQIVSLHTAGTSLLLSGKGVLLVQRMK